MPARSRREAHAIYLVPGFFGFANLGRLRYFTHIDRFLRARLAERGVRARIHVVRTHPTASLPRECHLVQSWSPSGELASLSAARFLKLVVSRSAACSMVVRRSWIKRPRVLRR